LNFAFNALCDATCLEDLELRRNDEVYLDAVQSFTAWGVVTGVFGWRSGLRRPR
jgi:hypothetical protein